MVVDERVAGAQREDPQAGHETGHPGLLEGAVGDLEDGPVAAAGDQVEAAIPDRLPGKEPGVPGRRRRHHVGGDTALQEVLDQLLHPPAAPTRPRRRVDDEEGATDGGGFHGRGWRFRSAYPSAARPGRASRPAR